MRVLYGPASYLNLPSSVDFFVLCLNKNPYRAAELGAKSGRLSAASKKTMQKAKANDLRHSFGSLLIPGGAPLTYGKERMGHSCIQVTVDIYGHLIPGANIACADRLDSETSRQQSATPAQPRETQLPRELSEVVEKIGGGGWTRTNDLGIMRFEPHCRRVCLQPPRAGVIGSNWHVWAPSARHRAADCAVKKGEMRLTLSHTLGQVTDSGQIKEQDF